MSNDLTEKVAYAIFREHDKEDVGFHGLPREVSLKAARAVLALLDDLETCDHPNADGIDGADIDDPYKVWECSKCGERFADTEAHGNPAAEVLRAAADEFATGDRVMERCTRGLVAAWLRDRAHLIESGEQP